MLHKNNPILYLKRKRAFVEAAAGLIETQPFNSVSIRRIADAAGFHNSTIYSYFQDVDWLLGVASVRFLQPYSDELMRINHNELNPFDQFYAIWECFIRHAVSYPCLYYKFFFGKYRNQLIALMEEYYELYPDKKNAHPQLVSDMFQGGTIMDRCFSILKPLTDSPLTRITKDNLYKANYIIVSTLEEYLADLSREDGCFTTSAAGARSTSEVEGEWEGEDGRSWFEKTDFMEMLHFIVDR